MFFSETNGIRNHDMQLADERKVINNCVQKYGVDSPFKMLNKRQMDVLIRLAKGMTAYEISKELSISEDTIRFHKKNIFNKLEANCTVQAVIKAIKSNYLNINDI